MVLVLGDQLDRQSAVFDEFDPARDVVWMAENVNESTYVWSHKLRLAFFFSAMRHFRDVLRDDGITVQYHPLSADAGNDRGESFADLLAVAVRERRPKRLLVVQPGDTRVEEMLTAKAAELGLPLDLAPDRHFYLSPGEFAAWADGRKSLLMETFYRMMRKRENILLEPDGEPVGGSWNYDHDNRESFGSDGPPEVKRPREFTADAVTEEVVAMVNARFADHPGQCDRFVLPVTHEQGQAMVRDFVEHRLPTFGQYQDAMWTDLDFGSHSRISAAMNVKLIDPRYVIAKVLDAYDAGHAPLASVEGFVRQVIGWREYIRGVYWLQMPGYAEKNALDAHLPVPQFFWDGQTDMACVADAMNNVIENGYAHHIQRLMVLGLFAQNAGVHPYAFHEWHMAMYLDSIDWASLPNTLGMSQYGDGGIVGSKPYVATGAYINRMSNYCSGCRYHPKQATGDDACPFTTLYWDFLDRHAERFRGHRRMALQVRNIDRKSNEDRAAIRKRAEALQDKVRSGERF